MEHPTDCDSGSLPISPADSSINKPLRHVNSPCPPAACLSALPVRRLIMQHAYQLPNLPASSPSRLPRKLPISLPDSPLDSFSYSSRVSLYGSPRASSPALLPTHQADCQAYCPAACLAACLAATPTACPSACPAARLVAHQGNHREEHPTASPTACTSACLTVRPAAHLPALRLAPSSQPIISPTSLPSLPVSPPQVTGNFTAQIAFNL